MLAKKIIYTFCVKVSASLCSYLVSILLVRKGGAELAGEFFSWLAYLLIFSSVIRFGLDHKIVKEVAYSSDSDKSFVIGRIFQICTLMSVVFFPLSYLLSMYLGENTVIISVLFALSCGTFSAVYLLGNVFQGVNRADITIFVQEIFIWVFLFLFLMQNSSITLETAWALYSFGLISSLVFSLLLLKLKFNTFPTLSFSTSLTKYLKETVPYFSGIVGHVALQWAPLIFLSLFSSAFITGQFVAIQRTAMLVAFMLGVFNLVTNPIYARYFAEKNYLAVANLAKNISLLMFVISFPLLLVLVVFSDSLIGFYGDSFKSISLVFVTVAASQLFNAITGSASYILTMGGNAKLVERSILCTLLLVFIVGPILTVKYELWGAAWTSIISLMVFNGLNVYFLFSKMGISILPTKNSIAGIISNISARVI